MASRPICPAVMFAPNLIVRAKGLTNMPIISIGIRMISTGAGTLDGIMFFQYPPNPCFIDPATIMEKKVIDARAAVK